MSFPLIENKLENIGNFQDINDLINDFKQSVDYRDYKDYYDIIISWRNTPEILNHPQMYSTLNYIGISNNCIIFENNDFSKIHINRVCDILYDFKVIFSQDCNVVIYPIMNEIFKGSFNGISNIIQDYMKYTPIFTISTYFNTPILTTTEYQYFIPMISIPFTDLYITVKEITDEKIPCNVILTYKEGYLFHKNKNKIVSNRYKLIDSRNIISGVLLSKFINNNTNGN